MKDLFPDKLSLLCFITGLVLMLLAVIMSHNIKEERDVAPSIILRDGETICISFEGQEIIIRKEN